jgi:hypothetical protein
MRFAIALLVLVPAAVHAEPRNDTITTPLVDLPFVIGGGNDGFLIGARPEILLGRVTLPMDWTDGMRGVAVGVMGEVNWIGGHTVVGTGVEVVRLYRRLRIEPSVGVYDRIDEARGITASLFVGLHLDDRSQPWEQSFGLRLIGRVDTEGASQTTSVELAFQIDPMMFAALGGGFVRAFTIHN